MSTESNFAGLRYEEHVVRENGGTPRASAPDTDSGGDYGTGGGDDWDPDSPFPFPTPGDKTSQRTPDCARVEADHFIFEAKARAESDQSASGLWDDRPIHDHDNTCGSRLHPDPCEPEPICGQGSDKSGLILM